MLRGATRGGQGMPRSDLTTSMSSLEETFRQNLGLLWYHLREYRGARRWMVSSTAIAASIILVNLLKNVNISVVWPFFFTQRSAMD